MADTQSPIPNETVSIETSKGKTIEIGNSRPVAFIAGPCAMEDRDHALFMANALAEIGEKTGAAIIYKTSFDKANRTSAGSYRGVGIDEALKVFD
ncbi:MAG: 3-deoxy-8-phosphooctulonate synthase, partial [Hyphomonadaceae bacterium]